jgi:transposase
MRRKIVKKAGKHFSIADQHKIIQEMISSGCTKRAIWKKYTGQDEEKGQLLRWMNKLGYTPYRPKKKANLEEQSIPMVKKVKIKSSMEASEQEFELLQMQKRIFELEKQLKDAELKAIAYSTMVDIAEKEFNIPIRKKLSTKPLKK